MGLFGGPHKTIKKLDEVLISARLSLNMYRMLPEANRAIALQRIPVEVEAAARAASRAGCSAEARALLERAAGKPPESEPPELSWRQVIGGGLAAL